MPQGGTLPSTAPYRVLPENQLTDTTPPRPAIAIKMLSTQYASLYRHLHPILLLGVLRMRFPALVQTPTKELLNLLLVATALQVVYCILCLPPAGTGGEKKKLKPGEKQLSKKRDEGVSVVMTTLLSLALTLITTLPLHITLILFGAPLITLIPHTALAASHAAVLSLFPLLYTHGVDTEAWISLLGLNLSLQDNNNNSEVLYPAIGTLLGAWLGAIPIPLDWDRAWQAWPITIVVGMWMGNVVGGAVGKIPVGKKKWQEP